MKAFETPTEPPSTPQNTRDGVDAGANRLRELAVREAYALSEIERRPVFVYRLRLDPPPYILVFDEEIARERCDDDGYTRCDASEGVHDGG